MAPLAPKPPFATDKPDSFYEQPQPRLRQPPPLDPNQRTSAYNLYVLRVDETSLLSSSLNYIFILDMTTILVMNLSRRTTTNVFSPPHFVILV